LISSAAGDFLPQKRRELLVRARLGVAALFAEALFHVRRGALVTAIGLSLPPASNGSNAGTLLGWGAISGSGPSS
jgi:hypothetical protein